MIYLEEKTSTVSKLIENQFPYFVQESTPNFLKFLTSYYESQEGQYQPLDIAANLVDYYNIGYYRPNRLVQNNTLTGNVSLSDTTINVNSTKGFPYKNGYIKIDNEIIFYRDKTETQFTNCVRGTKALILDNVPLSNLTLTTSVKAEHLLKTKVVNIAYNFANEFLSRIKKEIAPFIPEVVDSQLDLGGFLKKIKSFYLSKGSLNSHRILFRILFNDRKFRLKLKPRGSGAKIQVDNIDGQALIASNPLDGGTGYDSRKSSGTLTNPPLVEVFGTGRGTVVNNTRPNKTAKITVTDISAVNGAILTLRLDDPGEAYVGPITARVRPAKFREDEIVTNLSGTGTGKVEFYDAFNDELILYDVVGYFSPEDDVSTQDGEKARAFVKRMSDGSGVTIQGEQQQIEFPKEYTFKTSASDYKERKILRCKFIPGNASSLTLPDAFTLKQDSDTLFGIKGVSIETDNSWDIFGPDFFEIEVSTNTDLNDIYLQPTTLVTRNFDSNTDTILTVDDASRFPITNGIIRFKSKEIEYTNRSVNQFFGCTVASGFGRVIINAKDEVISYGRKKINVQWATNQVIRKDEYRFYGDNLYLATNDGVTGSTAPTHTVGSKPDGSILTSIPPITWRYFGRNRFDHTFYIDNANKPRLQVLGMPGDIIVTDGAALHTDTTYEFSRLNSPNADYYNFTTNELSDRLAVVLGSNVNRSRNIVNDARFASNGSLYGFNNQYDYGDHVYVASSGIPRWWNDLIPAGTPSAANAKKIAFQNQKIVQRWKKSSLVSDTQAIGSETKTKKTIGLNIDGIQINSYKGSTIEYGEIDKFVISNGGTYPVPYDSTGLKVDLLKLPKFDITGTAPGATTAQNTSVTITLSNTSSKKLIRLSSSIKSIDFNKLTNQYLTDGVTANPFYGKLTGFDSKPVVSVINNNPSIKLEFSNFQYTNAVTDEITFVDHGLNTGDVVTFNANDDYFDGLTPGDQYYVRKIRSDLFTLHPTKSDALLNQNIASLQSVKSSYITVNIGILFSFEGEQRNPANYAPLVLDISYANGNIDNIIIKESGAGYIELPTIRISGGGKQDVIDIPFQINDIRMIETSGSLISYDNFDKTNSIEIDGSGLSSQQFIKQPTIKISDGKNAVAAAYVANGKLFNIVIIDQGENYFIPPAITLSGGGGTGGVVTAETDANGKITRFNIVNAGSGYETTPRVIITPLGVNGGITCRLKEWTFNLVRRFKKDDRLDAYGGYVHDSGDVKPSVENERGFNYLNYTLDFPKDINEKQYYLMHGTDRLRARYIYEKNVANARAATISSSLDSSLVSPTNPDGTKPFKTWADANSNYVTQLDALPVHTPVMGVSYDGIPFYSGKKVNTLRNVPDDGTGTKLSEIQSRYKLKYKEVSASTSGRLGPFNVQGVNKYVTIDREGGPSLSEYPIGTFIQDYEYEKGTLDDLDQYNGRFCITPDFPDGRYCYFITTSSFDGITNELVNLAAANNNGINFNGFPYFIGDTFAGEYDNYMNSRCRTNDKIPKAFTRAYEKQIDDIPTVVNGAPAFRGLLPNNEYPQEDIKLNRTIANTGTKSQGTVDSVIIEASGDNYGVGDRVIVDNSRTFGSDFAAFVSRVGGKDFLKKTSGELDIIKSSDGKIVTFKTIQPHFLTVGDYVYFDYKQPLDPQTGKLDLIELAIHNNASKTVSTQITRLYNVQITPKIIDGVEVNIFGNKEIYSLELNSRYTYKIYTPPLNVSGGPSLWYEIDKVNEWFQVTESGVNDHMVIDASKIPDTLYLHSGNYIYVITKVPEYKGSHIISDVDSSTNQFTVKFNSSTSNYNDLGLYYAAKSYGTTGPIDTISVSNEGFGYRSLPEVTGIIKRGTIDTIAGDGKAVLQTNSNTIGELRNVKYSSFGAGFTCNENVNYYLNLPATAKIINNFEISDITILQDPTGLNPTGGKDYNNAPIVLLDNIPADGTNASLGNAHVTVTVTLGTITKIEVLNPGAGFTKEPNITIQSTHGGGALFRASIRRKRLPSGNKLYYHNPDWTATSGYLTDTTNSKIFGVPVEATVVSFDEKTSTLVFNEDAGQFNADGDKNYIKTSDGVVYGRITSIRRSKAYAKVKSYGKLEETRKDIIGNSSENLQRLTDSHYYQDWSYSLTTSRDTKEWKDQQDINTHAAGFKQFGRKVIEKRKGFFDSPADVFSSSVVFTTTLSEELDLNAKLTPCTTQTVIFGSTSGFTVGSYVIGLTSRTIAYVLEVGQYFVKFRVRSGPGFQVGELVLSIPDSYAFKFVNADATDRNLVFWQGIWQEPTHSYTFASDLITITVTAPHTDVNTTNETFTVSNHGIATGTPVMYTAGSTAVGGLTTNTLYWVINDGTNTFKLATTLVNANGGTAINLTSQGAGTHTFTTVPGETFVPNFAFANNDNIQIYHPNVNKFDLLKTQTLTTSDSTLSFEKVGTSSVYPISNLGKVMISVAGSVQNPANLTVSNNTVNFGATPAFDSRVFAVGHQNLNSLTFAGSATGTQFTLNHTPSTNCKLLIFETSVFQTHIVPPSNYTVSGNVITFSSTATRADLFGWYIDEDIRCFKLDTSTWNDRQVRGILGCITKRFNEHIESNAVKAPADVAYEIRAKNISGTVYGTGSNSLRGFDTRFTYTSPERSSSYVEVLDPITLNGSSKTFTLKRGGDNYTPSGGEESLVVYLDNAVLDHDKYTVVGSQIIFTDAHASTVKCTLIDYVSSYIYDNVRGSILDRLGQRQSGNRIEWNLTDKGVPQYVANPTDVYVIKNGSMLRPDSSNYTISGNLLTFKDAPTATDNIKVPFFNRQLVPTSTNNLLLDEFKCNNGTTTVFPITSGGLLHTTIQANLFVMRNGVMQRSGTDYTVSTNQITFTTAPDSNEIIFGWYSYDGVNQNIMLDNLTGFNGSTATFNLTHSSGTAFTPPDVDDLMVVRNGVVQNPTQDYTVSGSQITFTTPPAASEQVWILYTHGAAELTIASQSAVNSNSWKITMSASPGSSAAEYRRVIVYADGAPRFLDRGDFTVSGNDIILDHTGSPAPANVFVVKYAAVTQIDDFDYCPDGVRTQFKMLLNGANIPNSTNTASILVSVDGVIKDPSSEYTFSANRGFINFSSAPSAGSKIFMVRMSNNLPVTLSASGSNYTISQSISAASGERDNLVIFSNNTWKFAELGDFTWVNDNTITLATAHTTGTLFGVKFTSIFKLLDQTDTAFAKTGDTFTLFDGRKRFTPTNATYNPANGNLVLTIPNHGLVQNQDVRIEPNSLKFKCAMDGGYAIKSYPRTSDPKYNTDINCDAVTTDTITLNVGTSPIVNYTPGNNTTYDPKTGKLVLDIGTTGANALAVGESIKLADGAVTFTCDTDQNQSNHVYPRTTIDTKTPETGTTYNPTTGIMTIKVTSHGFNEGDLIRIDNQSLTFTCTQGSGQHYYPRPTDRMGNGKWAPISNVTADFFDIQVLDSAPSTNTTTHTFVTAAPSSLSRKRDRAYDAPLEIIAKGSSTITVNVGTSADLSDHTFVANSGVSNSVITGGNYAHTFVSAEPRSVLTVGYGAEGQKVFNPYGTIANDDVPDETSLLVVKNGLILDPKVDYELVGDNKTQIKLASDPTSTDIISVRSVGAFDKLDTLTNQSNVTNLQLTKSSTAYYPNKHIERPRQWENQYLVVKDGAPLSPLYDYYVADDRIYFTAAQTFTKLVVLDFRGTTEDVKVLSRGYEVVIGDQLTLSGEDSPRTVTGITSPTVLSTTTYSGNNIFTWGSGVLGSTTISGGTVTALTTTSGSVGFKNPVILRTEGTGVGAKASATVSLPKGGEIDNSSIDIMYPGHNVYNAHKVFPTVYASTFKKQPVNKSEVRKGTKLTSNITNSVETIALKNTAGLTDNTPTFTITGTHSGTNASFRPFISGGKLRKLEIISGGSGYDDRDINITLTGGGGTGCVLEPVLNASGTITSLIIKDPGAGYDTFRVILYKTVSNVVNAEVVEYTNITSTGIEGCTRGVLGTAQAYSANDIVYFDNYI